MASLFQRKTKKGASWILQWIDHFGRTRTKSLGNIKKTAALRVKAEIEQQVALQKLGQVPLKQLKLEEFERTVKNWSSPATARRADVVFKHLKSYFGNVYADTISPIEWDEYFQHRLKKVGVSTVNREMNLLKAAWNKANNYNLMNMNTLAKIKKYKEPETVKKFIPMAHFQKLLNSYDLSKENELMWFVMWVVQFFTAARNGEMLSLLWPDVFDDYITIVNSKGAKTRNIWLYPMAKEALDMVPRKRDELTVFWHVRHSTSMSHRMAEDFEKLGLPKYTPHHLRHTFATMADKYAKDIHGLKEILRHSDIRTTEHYSRFMDLDNQKSIIEIVASHFPLLKH
jgi:integrase